MRVFFRYLSVAFSLGASTSCVVFTMRGNATVEYANEVFWLVLLCYLSYANEVANFSLIFVSGCVLIVNAGGFIKIIAKKKYANEPVV